MWVKKRKAVRFDEIGDVGDIQRSSGGGSFEESRDVKVIEDDGKVSYNDLKK